MTTTSDVQAFRKERYKILAEVLAPALEQRNYEVHVCESSAEALRTAVSLMPAGSSVAWGGSASVEQIGLLDAVRNGDYVRYDRETARTPDEREDVIRKAFFADYYLTSFNGVSLNGMVYNADGMGNRVAAITYGPRNVIAVVGMNKVCHSEEGARERATGEAAEVNAVRFKKGSTLFTDEDVTDDVPVKDRICNYIEQIAWCREKGRIKVILVCEDLGF